MTKQKRIRWTDKEWDKLAERVWWLRAENPSSSLTCIIREAQQVLPQSRRREIVGLTMVPQLLDRLTTIDLQKHETINRLSEQVEELKESSTTKDEVLSKLTSEEVDNLFREQILSRITAESLMGEIDQRRLLELIPLETIAAFTAEMQIKLLTQAARRSNTHRPVQKPITLATQNNKPRLPKVAVFGALNHQGNRITQALRQTADVICVDKDSRNIPDKADLYVLWLNFISHGLQNRVKSIASPDKIVQVKGGLHKIVRKIRKSLR